jgi:serine/threonine protein kinase
MPSEGHPVHFGSFELIEVLGEGAMARVYRARQTGPMGFSKEVALKRLRKGSVGRDRREIEALVNEARLGGQLRHPNLVEVYGCEVVDGSFCLAMEYVEGWELDEVLWRLSCAEVRLPQPAVIDILRQIADGIAYAHAATDELGLSLKLVHRDLKPQNIFLDKRGVVKIADFGLAKSTANLYQTTEANVTRGSPLYMSPEQIEGKPLDGRSDLFAIGSIASELSTGVRPFEGNSIPNTLIKILAADFGDSLSIMEAEFPQLAPIVRRLFAQLREERYRDGYALLGDLELLSDGRSVGAHTRALALALGGADIRPLSADLRALYGPVEAALSGGQRDRPPVSGSPAPALNIPPPPSFVSPHIQPASAPQPPPRRPEPPRAPSRPPSPPRSETQTLRTAREQTLRSLLITIFSLAVSVYFIGLYFEVFAPPKVILAQSNSFEELPPGPAPAIDPGGRIIHVPPGIAHADADVPLSVRTVLGEWEVDCFYRPLGEPIWSQQSMTEFNGGRHGVTLPTEAFREGAAEYYFEAVSSSSGELVRSGSAAAPFRIQTR